MELYPWEEKAYIELRRLYNAFYRRLAELGEKCYQIDANELFSANIGELTYEQKELIRNYWKKYRSDIGLNYHRYYIDKTGKFDVRFIPDDIYAGYIDGYLNNRSIEPGISDKNYFDLYLCGFKMPLTYIHLINNIYEDSSYNIINKAVAIQILVDAKRFIVKPSMASYGGKNIQIFENPTYAELKNFFNNNKINNLIFQEIIEQNSMTALLHPSSLNTIRIMTLILDNTVKVLSPIFRIGIGDSVVDNASNGGIYCRIESDGSLSNYAYDSKGNRFNCHPDGGDFSNVKFEFMDDVKKLVINAAQRFPHFRLIGWDIAVNTNNEPVIIEANLTMSSIDIIESICGPLFGEYTDRVLDEVFGNNEIEPIIDILQYI